ncbi:uncharacterized protein J7T54_000263 [Emericellopsis cladophorae]|uniref:Uncharacterized protein n=1 Tax=Emericellopsis cladophorae TaxID=2686198 RepID=A0A9P9XYJ3_9HYPO|nr:uncharacterized protein J7T54_000263 [Emericellopsis cladophorae]KAI6779963.1 hypothetical protein J7T54_000263 [Emericellopsis cladophorae]
MLPTCGTRRQSLIVLAVFAILLCSLFYNHNDLHVPRLLVDSRFVPKPHERLPLLPVAKEDLQKVHVLLPAPSRDVSTCKTLLSATVMGYPIPHILGHGEGEHDETLIGGGRHLSKIEKTLEWLSSQPPEHASDTVVVVDAYGAFNHHPSNPTAHATGEAWFQLPLDVLLKRYRGILESSNRRLAERMGVAFEKEHDIRQRVVFGADKMCTPADPASVACYPIPESPLPKEMYGVWTEDMRLNHTTHLHRYLSANFIVGSVEDVTRVFTRASQKIDLARNSTNGAYAISGSDQAVFQHMFGEQEYRREALRRRHHGGPADLSVVEGVLVHNPLNPTFPHEVPDTISSLPDLGIAVDYWADLAVQTDLHEDDGRWLTYGHDIPSQLIGRRAGLCVSQVDGALPLDLLNTTTRLPRAIVSDAALWSPARGWDEMPLYSNLCLDTIPVVVNHNGPQEDRHRDWPEMWMQPHARRILDGLMKKTEEEGRYEIAGGAYIDWEYTGWEQLCPAGFESELYRETAFLGEQS